MTLVKHKILGYEGLVDGVTKLKILSSDINSELDLHQHLLSDLDSAVDNTDHNMQRNILRVEIVTEKSSSCAALCCIFFDVCCHYFPCSI